MKWGFQKVPMRQAPRELMSPKRLQVSVKFGIAFPRQNRFFTGGEENENIIYNYFYWFFDIFCFGLLTSRRTGLDIILDLGMMFFIYMTQEV